MRALLKKIPLVTKIVRAGRGAMGITPESLSVRQALKERPGRIEKYLTENSVRKLQIGAQSNSISGWFNVDIDIKEPHVTYMDATQPFPIADGAFDYVFAEHMIEHISFEEADHMLSESFRIMKEGATIRIATPNLEKLAQLMISPNEQDHATYIDAYFQRFFPDELPKDPVFVVNKLFYSFHHRFIHSEASLRYLLEKQGFRDFRRCQVGQSDMDHLKGIEQHAKEIGEIPNFVETIVVEATR